MESTPFPLEMPNEPEHFLHMGVSTVTKCWHFVNPDPTMGRREHVHKVYLRHGRLTGAWMLFMDGHKIQDSAETNTGGMSFETRFTIDSSNATLIVELSQMSYSYRLLVGAVPVKDVLSASEETAVQPIEPVSVVITGSRTTIDATKSVMKYRIRTNCKSNEGGTVIAPPSFVERRYREFETLDVLLRSMYANSHLVTSFPELPGKCLNPFTDQQSLEFISQRQNALQLYLQALVGISKLCSNPDLLLFLGMHPTTGKPLGVSLAGDFDEDDDGIGNASESKVDESKVDI